MRRFHFIIPLILAGLWTGGARACDLSGSGAFAADDCAVADLQSVAKEMQDDIAFLHEKRPYLSGYEPDVSDLTCAEDQPLCRAQLAEWIALEQTQYALPPAVLSAEYALLCDGMPTYIATYDTATYPAASVWRGRQHAVMVQSPDAGGVYSGAEGASLDGIGTQQVTLSLAGHDKALACTSATDARDFDTVALAAICERVTANFYDPALNGLNWPAECAAAQRELAEGQDLADVAARLLAKLETSHTSYYAKEDPTLAILYSVFDKTPNVEAATPNGRPQLRGAGFFTTQVDGKTFVDQVLDGSPAARAGILSGDEIVRDGGSNFRAVWPDNDDNAAAADMLVRRTPGGEPMPVSVDLMTGDALEILAKATADSVRIIERDGKRIGYLHGWTMLTRDGVGGPRIALEDAWWGGRFDGVDAIILDARGRIGGGGTDILDVYFSPAQTQSGFRSRLSRDWKEGKPRLSDIPLITVIDHHSRSGAEVMAWVMRDSSLSTLVGSTTARAVTGGTIMPLPNGAALYLAVAGFQIGDKPIEGVGVDPHIPVAPAPVYSAGDDPQLERAIAEAVRQAR